jgi:DNA-binding FadR family transcriptional regulator
MIGPVTSGAGRGSSRPGRTPLRVGDKIADVLRERILAGEFTGGLLPKQEDLMAEFGVSAPSVREAFRTLEAEGLITVRRGNVGGATVHVPDASSTARAIGLALQSDEVTLSDVSAALCMLDAWAVATCAQRPDRATAVVPLLTERVEEADATLSDARWWALSLRFHEDLADLAGNGTMRLVITSLLSLWHEHAEEWISVLGHERYVSKAPRRAKTTSPPHHVARIASGDVAAAQAAAEQHLAVAHQTMLRRPDVTVRVTDPRKRRGRTR